MWRTFFCLPSSWPRSPTVQQRSDNPVFAEEMDALDFMQHPDETIIQALLLKFKPVHMDVLPLYIVLLLLFPPILWLLQRAATAALGLSVLLYALNWHYGLEPEVLSGRRVVLQSARLAIAVRVRRLVRARRRRPLVACLALAGDHCVAVSYLLFAFAITLTWYFPRFGSFHPALAWRMDVSDRQDQSRRFALCAFSGARGDHGAVRAVRCAVAQIENLASGDSVRPAFAGNILSRRVSRVRRRISSWSNSITAWPCKLLVSVVGVLTMVGTAALISWYKSMERGSGPPKRPPDADLAGDRHEDRDRGLTRDSRRRKRSARAAVGDLRGSRLFDVRR